MMRCLECGAEIAERTQVCARCGSWAPAEYQLYVAEDRAAEAACDTPGGPAPPAMGASVGQQSPESAPDPDVDGAVLAEWVETRRFSTTRRRPGYDQEEVDAFLDAIRDSFLGVREPSVTPDEIRAIQFSTTRLRPGYDEEEVDAFLDEAESRLAAQVAQSGGQPQDEPAGQPQIGELELLQSEHEARQERERQTSVKFGIPAWQVLVKLPSHRDVVALAGHLSAQGWPVHPHRRSLIVGANCEDDAKSLAQALSGDGRAAADTAFGVRRVDLYATWTWSIIGF